MRTFEKIKVCGEVGYATKSTKYPKKGVFMKRMLVALFALSAMCSSGALFAERAERSSMRGVGETEYRCGHCHARIEHAKAPCRTHGCPGASVKCVKEKTVVVEEEVERACDTVYSCPEGSEEIPAPHEKCGIICEKTIAKKVRVPANETISCGNACKADEHMVEKSERDHHSARHMGRLPREVRR